MWEQYCQLKKFPQYFALSFVKTFGNILPPSWAISLPHKKINWEITYTMLCDIFIFVTKIEMKIFAKILNIVARF